MAVPSERFVELIQPFCDLLKLPILSYHLHEFLATLFLYQFIYAYLGPRISNYLAPKTYGNLQGRSKLDWNIHVVSMTQATIISLLAQYVVLFDEERKQMNAMERAYGYTNLSAKALAVADGYFVWHFFMMVVHYKVYGFPMLAHAWACNFVMIQGFRPAFLTYGVASFLYEWSNIPLNIHRALGKLNMQSSRLYVVNGISLFVVFFCCRIIWGTYLTWAFWQDLWFTYSHEPPPGAEKLPTWLLVGHAISAGTLQTLNFVWFFMISRIMLSRFVSKNEKKWTGIKEK
ncbi:hypothetical protein BS50DRAFT_496235 [Corynespora cassiicola Philippines]|uniref:TLC domain-containing protein n=1 Tax=Corynespora cassiicola Philippines TaxID=1448308 RepID=A0A2T2NJN6_CORCC|nr:hypothetical protein BS50DRAFT_496235 [Corynespora cassiicola Philippines]